MQCPPGGCKVCLPEGIPCCLGCNAPPGGKLGLACVLWKAEEIQRMFLGRAVVIAVIAIMVMDSS